MSARHLQDRDGSILVVCTGNVCRSPYIERRLRAELPDIGLRVESAGTGALVGSDMDPRVAQRLAQAGISSEGFAGRQLTPDIARAADLILAASREHRSEVVRLEPSVLRRTYALADFSDLAEHLLEASQNELVPTATSNPTNLSELSVAAARARGEVRARTKEEAEIVDPYRAPDKVLERMFEQVEQLLPPVVAVLRNAADYD